MPSRSLIPTAAGRLIGHWARPALVALFLALAMLTAFDSAEHIRHTTLLLAAVLTAGYLALNIGANDAANNIGTAVGSGALTLTAALLLAATGELAGALLASDPVSARLREGLFHPEAFGHGQMLARVLITGMLGAGLWVHAATLFRVPVSATHSVVGGLLGAAVSANGWSAVQWDQISSIALAWLITPFIATLISAAVLFGIERTITYQPNLIGSARTRVPILIALLALLFGNYFLTALAPADWHAGEHHLPASLAVALAAFLVAQPLIHRMSQQIKNNRKGVNQLFTAPLILAAAFFAFAHGANDVANIAAPLTAAANIAVQGTSPEHFILPGWSLAIGALGIAVGLAAYGSRLVRTVGSEITELDKLRAFCIAFSAALVVLAASHFGFPVSTTHILVGSIFGVGLLREQMRLHDRQTLEKVRKCHEGEDREALDLFLNRFRSATLPRKKEMLEGLYRERGGVQLTRKELRRIHKHYHRQLVKRTLMRRIVAFWILTIPAAAILGGLLYRLAQAVVD